MNGNNQHSSKQDIRALIEAFSINHSEDAFRRTVTMGQWRAIASYMQPFALAAASC